MGTQGMANAQVTSWPLWQSRVFVITILPITTILILLVGGYFYVDYTTQVEVILDHAVIVGLDLEQ
jgi:hypothetical protein